MDFKGVFQLLLGSFEKAKIDVALIGGFALHSAGYTRMTNDIDFLIGEDDVRKVKVIMSSAGYELLHESEEVSNFVSRLSGLGRVDFLHARRHYTKAMLERAVKKDILGDRFKVKVILPEDLIGLKVQSSSNDPARYHQDMADIEATIRANHSKLDMELIKEYFDLFGRGDELQKILEKLNDA